MIKFLKKFCKANGTDSNFLYENYYERNVIAKLQLATELKNKEMLPSFMNVFLQRILIILKRH